MTNTYTTVQKLSQWKFVNIKKNKKKYLMVTQGYIYLIENTVKKKKQSEASVMGSFRNHYNVLIWCSINLCKFFCGYHDKNVF